MSMSKTVRLLSENCEKANRRSPTRHGALLVTESEREATTFWERTTDFLNGFWREVEYGHGQVGIRFRLVYCGTRRPFHKILCFTPSSLNLLAGLCDNGHRNMKRELIEDYGQRTRNKKK